MLVKELKFRFPKKEDAPQDQRFTPLRVRLRVRQSQCRAPAGQESRSINETPDVVIDIPATTKHYPFLDTKLVP